jgi:hypothetical protein
MVFEKGMNPMNCGILGVFSSSEARGWHRSRESTLCGNEFIKGKEIAYGETWVHNGEGDPLGYHGWDVL